MEVPSLLVERQGAAPPPFHPSLDGAEQELHVHGLRARPPAPHPAEQRGQEEDRDDDAREQEHQQQRIRRQERRSEQREVPPRQIEQDERLASHP
jgi:hypothetical protein